MPNILSSSSCLHVQLLVFLRLLAVSKPLKYKEIHRSLRHISITIIWILSICVCLIPVFTMRFLPDNRLSFYCNRILVLHGLHTIPILCIVLLYVILIRTIHNTRRSVSSISSSPCISTIMAGRNRQRKMMKGIVVCLIVCYLPYLLWWEYSEEVLSQRRPIKFYKIEVLL